MQDNTKLEEYRKTIDQLDEQIVKAISERIDVIVKVGEFKRANNLPPLDKARWLKVLEKAENRAKDFGVSEVLIHDIFEMIHQNSLELEGSEKVYYLGPEGSYSYLAALEMFSPGNSLHYALYSFQEIRDKVLNENVIGILPIENSITSNIHENIDALYSAKFKIVGEGYLDIKLNLVAIPGVELRNIKKVFSHPKALEQCSHFLSEHGISGIAVQSTSEAMQEVLKLKDKNVAAIGSFETATELKLEITSENIGNYKNNQTRFIAIKKREPDEKIDISNKNNKVSLIFNAKHEVGSLSKVLQTISTSGGNLTKIESRPLPESDWLYSFLIDIEGADLDKVVKSIEDITENMVILGAYNLLTNKKDE